jgi:hypothetical protein
MSHWKVCLACAGTVLLAAVVIAPSARSEDSKTTAPPAAGDQQAQMDAWAAAAKPGPEHEWLKSFTGDWDADVKFLTNGGGASKGVMHGKLIMGGRYLQLDYDGSMDGPTGPTPFKGMGLVGYDKGKKKYTDLWIDEMSTGMVTYEGTRQGDAITLDGTTTDPMSGQPMKVREVITLVDKDHYTYEFHVAQGEGAALSKMMEIKYSRKG